MFQNCMKHVPQDPGPVDGGPYSWYMRRRDLITCPPHAELLKGKIFGSKISDIVKEDSGHSWLRPTLFCEHSVI